MLSRLGIFMLAAFLFFGCRSEIAPVNSPEEELSTFQLAENVDIQLVAAEPMVEEPVAITFDKRGRLWVVEMRGFMPDIDGTGEGDPVGRISVLIDKDQDGRMDQSIVFLDSLVLPRSIALVSDGILVAEQFPLWYVPDLDGDLRADRKILIDSSYGGNGLVEHSPNGLWRGIDNWYYSAKSTARYRLKQDIWVRAETEFRGQFGISHDDHGRLFYNYNWSQLHADLVPPNYLSRNQNHIATTGIDHGLTIDRAIHPARSNPATNRGYIDGTLDEEGKLIEFTSACSPFVYRGTALPQFRGNVFVAEPAGNLVKRNIVDYSGVVLSAEAAYDKVEFLASTDERFRPVAFTSGPDGALYIADMYRGIIEHGPYISEYLREQILERGLDKHIHLGRIWRIVPKDFENPPLKISDKSDLNQLIKLLSSDDGWYRDLAQRLLVESGDTTIYSDLVAFLENEKEYLGKIHALYVLDGLSILTKEICQRILDINEPIVQSVALRLLEKNFSDRESLEIIRKFITRYDLSSEPLTLQCALTAGILPKKEKIPFLFRLLQREGDKGLFRDALLSSLENDEFEMFNYILRHNNSIDISISEVFIEMLSIAIFRKGAVDEIEDLFDRMIPTENELDPQQRAMVRGLSLGKVSDRPPIKLSKAPAIFEIDFERDPPVAKRLKKLSTMFSWPGHVPEKDPQGSVELNSEEQALFNLGRQHYMTSCASCHGVEGEGLSRFAPPVVDSEWVLGDSSRLALLVLHGIEGKIEVNGKIYQSPEILPVMPSHSILDDRTIASILTYIRCEWGHNAGPVRPSTISFLRHRTQGRVQPWSVPDLLAHEAAKRPSAEKQ